MARPPGLSPLMVEQARRRRDAGESVSALAAEYGISISAMSRYVSGITGKVRNVAEKLAAVQAELGELSVPQQYSAISLAEQLRNMSSSLASAGELGAKTAHRLNALANAEVTRVDDAKPMESIETLRNVGVLTKLANESANIAVSLLAANKSSMAGNGGLPTANASELSDDQLAAVLAGSSSR